MDVDDNFYDELASFMPAPGDYDLDDLDEILRSTDSHLDSSIDFNNLDLKLPQNAQSQKETWPKTEFSFDLNEISAADSADFTTPAHTSPRTSSTSSTDGDNFNPDEFINFFNDENVKNEFFTQNRNTPSPTGSCASSGGSSTSGVQSDVSSVASLSHTYNETNVTTPEQITGMEQFMKMETDTDINTDNNYFITNLPTDAAADCANLTIQNMNGGMNNLESVVKSEEFTEMPEMLLQNNFTVQAMQPIVTTSTVVPISIPVLPIQTATSTATIQFQPVQQVQPVIIPVKTVQLATGIPLANIKKATTTTVLNTNVKIEPKVETKMETKIAPKNGTQPVKLIGSNINAAKNTQLNGNNFKPKTVFLSSNDFKALMQKMNSNGKGAKITGGINGSMPKIIMKTANGKVITANKIVQPAGAGTGTGTGTSNSQANTTHFVPKIVKASGPMVIKQQATKAHANAAAKVPATASTAPDLSVYKGIMDEKMLKKQQRMIKNRESASLSRKKKKEYVTSLESRINNLEKENYSLKGENSSLRSQLMAFAQTCQCKNSNISEFILHSLNINNCEQNVKSAPKSSMKSIKQRMSTANMRKNVAVLFAMAFMVTMNVGNFQNYLNKQAIENSIEAAEEPASTGRRLLWVDSDRDGNETAVNHIKREAEFEVPPPPLHFIRPVNRTRAGITYNSTAHEPPLGAHTSGTDSFNQTENLRLASNLHKWIDGNDFFNLSLYKSFDNDLDNHVGFKLTPDYFETIDLPLEGKLPNSKQKRKYLLENSDYERKQPKLETELENENGNGNGRRKVDDFGYVKSNGNRHGNVNGKDNDESKNSLDLYRHKLSDEYLRFFKGINRKDDTFYVLSFNMDHVLLPASAYNKSARPKMSLMLPAGDPSINGDIVLMQIDCEVVNTTELSLKSHMIPEKLRPTKYSTAPNANDVAQNETGAHGNKVHEKILRKPDETRVKPPIKTYFMAAAKSQAALKKKISIVKLDGNGTMDGISVKNSTFYAKMRDTTQEKFKP